jgi:disease resistance protein RPM1
MGSLKELQILEDVDIKRTSWKAIKELRELTQLRKLAVEGRGAPKKKCKAFCETASKLYSLRSLNVSTTKENKEAGALDMLVDFTSPLPSLESLKLKGRLQKVPIWIGKSVKLVKIDLQFCELKELDALAQLPNLLQLRLCHKAYAAEKLVFSRDAFAKLRILHLQGHDNMAPREVTFEQSTSPNLEKISIEICQLTSGITGIEHLPKLKEIFIKEGRLANQDILKEEVDKHMNHPVLQIHRCEEPGVKVEVIRESISEAGESSQS